MIDLALHGTHAGDHRTIRIDPVLLLVVGHPGVHRIGTIGVLIFPGAISLLLPSATFSLQVEGLDDTARISLTKLAQERVVRKLLVLFWIRDECMLDDDAWNATLTRVSDDRIVIAHAAVRILAVSLRILCFDATVRKPQCGKLVQDLLAQFLASRMRILVIAAIVRIPNFCTMSTRRCRVDMDAHEHRCALFSCTTNALDKARQFILRTGHIHANILILLEFSLACLRDLPIYICLIETIGSCTWIGSSMTRIERNHDRAIISLRRNALFGSSRSHNACRCIKIARPFELPLIVERIDGHIPIGHFFSFGLSTQGHARVLLRLECAVGTLFCKIERIGLLLA